ncbi:hypothetical protein C8R44DRAFT_862679 [Mycena epipterygia]|nr:hypothetical protein C8R44DRAFT_862679 [Mycena epipterygia]
MRSLTSLYQSAIVPSLPPSSLSLLATYVPYIFIICQQPIKTTQAILLLPPVSYLPFPQLLPTSILYTPDPLRRLRRPFSRHRIPMNPDAFRTPYPSHAHSLLLIPTPHPPTSRFSLPATSRFRRDNVPRDVFVCTCVAIPITIGTAAFDSLHLDRPHPCPPDYAQISVISIHPSRNLPTPSAHERLDEHLRSPLLLFASPALPPLASLSPSHSYAIPIPLLHATSLWLRPASTPRLSLPARASCVPQHSLPIPAYYFPLSKVLQAQIRCTSMDATCLDAASSRGVRRSAAMVWGETVLYARSLLKQKPPHPRRRSASPRPARSPHTILALSATSRRIQHPLRRGLAAPLTAAGTRVRLPLAKPQLRRPLTVNSKGIGAVGVACINIDIGGPPGEPGAGARRHVDGVRTYALVHLPAEAVELAGESERGPDSEAQWERERGKAGDGARARGKDGKEKESGGWGSRFISAVAPRHRRPDTAEPGALLAPPHTILQPAALSSTSACAGMASAAAVSDT